MAWIKWILDSNVSANTTDPTADSNSGFQTNTVVSAKKTNAVLRQSNLITVALMQALGIDGSYASSIGDATTGIQKSIKDALIDVVEENSYRTHYINIIQHWSEGNINFDASINLILRCPLSIGTITTANTLSMAFDAVFGGYNILASGHITSTVISSGPTYTDVTKFVESISAMDISTEEGQTYLDITGKFDVLDSGKFNVENNTSSLRVDNTLVIYDLVTL